MGAVSIREVMCFSDLGPCVSSASVPRTVLNAFETCHGFVFFQMG